jgi:predicted dienelactone hydrolase
VYPIDVAVFLLLIAAAALFAVGRWRPALPAALAAMGTALAALALHHWQAAPAAAIAAVAAACLWRGPALRRRWQRNAARAALALAIPGAAIPYLLFPLFALPAPGGPYAIGTTRIDLIDAGRRGVLEDGADARRRMTVQLWYPAAPGDRHPLARYLPSDTVATDAGSIARNALHRSFELQHLAAIPTHARLDAEPAGDGHPLFVFNHGYTMYPAQNTPLFERLASHGYVVASIGHPYDSARQQFADGWSRETTPLVVSPAMAETLGALVQDQSVQGWRRRFPAYAEAAAKDRLMRSTEAWLADTRFILATLARGRPSPLAARIARSVDFSRLAFGGMSFGGGIAAQACVQEPQCRAAISLDGVTYDPAMFDRAAGRPMLWLQSDWPRYPLYPNQPRDPRTHPMDFAFRHWTGPAAPDDFRFRVEGSGHLAFTDLIRMFRHRAPPALYGTISATEMDGMIGDFSLGFLDRFVEGKDSGFPRVQEARHASAIRHLPGTGTPRQGARPDSP